MATWSDGGKLKWNHQPDPGVVYAYVLRKSDPFADHISEKERAEILVNPYQLISIKISQEYNHEKGRYSIRNVTSGWFGRYARKRDAINNIPDHLSFFPPDYGEDGIIGTWM